jgi:oxygen-dependent protoporphyrinogen oxidase
MVVPKWNGGDETLAHFAQRRLGREAYEKLIDPMASGIFAGDPENMSLKSCFPKVFNLEQTYGSLIRGMIKLQKEAKKTGKKVGAGPGGVLTSFHDGMETMIKALTDFLGTRMKTGSPAVLIEKNSNGYIVHLEDGTSLEASTVVCATPAFNAAELVQEIDKELASILREIFYPSISVVCLGYRKEKIKRSLDGFGFLIPFREGRKILGTLWDSSIFPNRAPEGHVLLRTMLGGARRSALAEENEEKLIDLVLNEMKDIMEIGDQPDFAKVYTHRKGIPQYPPGHENRLQLIDEKVNKIKGLYITGNAYRGIGVNDCIENSYKLAERVVKEI